MMGKEPALQSVNHVTFAQNTITLNDSKFGNFTSVIRLLYWQNYFIT